MLNLFLTKTVFISEVQSCTATCFDVEGDILAIGMYFACIVHIFAQTQLVFLHGAGILEQSMGARSRLGIRVSYRPTWLHKLAKSIPGPLKSLKIPSRVMGGNIDSWNWVGTKYGIESTMLHKMFVFKAGIDLSSSAVSCYFVCVFEMCWPIGESFPHTHYMTTASLYSSIPSREKAASKSQFHKGINFSQWIKSVEVMPGGIKV